MSEHGGDWAVLGDTGAPVAREESREPRGILLDERAVQAQLVAQGVGGCSVGRGPEIQADRIAWREVQADERDRQHQKQGADCQCDSMDERCAHGANLARGGGIL